MHGTPSEFGFIQHEGAENVALAAREAGAKFIYAIGADKYSSIPYAKTKGMFHEHQKYDNQPSLVFGPRDRFFTVRSYKMSCGSIG